MSVGERLVTRKEWGAKIPKSRQLLAGRPKGNTIHWEGPHMGIASHDECAKRVRGIQAFHMNGKGWADIAYSSVVCPHGFVFEGRWLGARTAAQGTNEGNATHYAHCYLGGENDPLTDEARDAFADVVAFFRLNGAGPALVPHAHWHSTACPGPELKQLIAHFVKDGILANGGSGRPVFTGGIPDAVGLVARPGGGGWVVAADGGVFSIADTPFFGSMGGRLLNEPVVGGAVTPTGNGYWLVAADGGVFTFGDARFHGSLTGKPLAKPIAAMAPTADGGGYWLAGQDGAAFAFGNAQPPGSQPNGPLAAPVTAAAAVPGGGCVLVAEDGGVFAVGANFFGALAGNALNAPVVGIAPTPSGAGYLLFAEDGGVFAFGDAPFRGVYPKLLQEYARGERRILGGAVRGTTDASTWGYELYSDRLPVERYAFA